MICLTSIRKIETQCSGLMNQDTNLDGNLPSS